MTLSSTTRPAFAAAFSVAPCSLFELQAAAAAPIVAIRTQRAMCFIQTPHELSHKERSGVRSSSTCSLQKLRGTNRWNDSAGHSLNKELPLKMFPEKPHAAR
jgi:hypothetical protein